MIIRKWNSHRPMAILWPLTSPYYSFHSQNPLDDSRHVFPLALSTLMMSIFFLVLRPLLPGLPEGSLLLGIICGYVISEMVHYYLHHGSPSEGSWFYFFKKSHLKHHFEHPDEGEERFHDYAQTWIGCMTRLLFDLSLMVSFRYW